MFKPIDKTSRTSFVSVHDPAIDWPSLIEAELSSEDSETPKALPDAQRRRAAEAIITTKAALAARKHPSNVEKMLKFLDGQEPTRFILSVIDSSSLNRLQDECRDKPAELRWRCFLASVCDIENMPGFRRKDDRIDPGWAENTFIQGLRTVALDVGLAALMWNTLTEEDAKK